MTICEFNPRRAGFFSRCLKLDKYLCLNSLIVIMIGVFLLPKTGYLANITSDKLIELTNEKRIEAKLEPLTSNPLLEEAARAKAQAIIQSQEFNHEISGRKFSAWIKEAGYEYSIVGENLAIDFVTNEGVLKAWLQSPNHRKNIFNDEYQEIGLATAEGDFQGQSTIVVVQIFGAPPKEKNSPIAASAPLQNEPAKIPELAAAAWLLKQMAPDPLGWLSFWLKPGEKSLGLIQLARMETLKLFF